MVEILYGIVILYDFNYSNGSSLNTDYIAGTEYALKELSLNYPIALQWIRIDLPNEISNQKSTNTYVINLLHEHIETGCEAFITITKKLNTFLTIKYNIQQYSSQRIRDRRFLLLSDQIVDMEIFHHPAFNIYPYHLLVVPSAKSEHSLDLVTQKFVGTDNREEYLLLDTFHLTNCTFKNNAVLYPDKLENVEGRVVTVAAIEYIPYAFARRKPPNSNLYREWNSTGDKTIFFDGSEARILINFCILRNCTLEFRIHKDWGGVYKEKYTSSGQLGAIHLREADIAVSAIGSLYYDIFDSSLVIAQSSPTLLVPGPRPLSYALTPVLPFDKKMWQYSFITLFLCTICYYLIKVFSEIMLHEKENFKFRYMIRKDFKTSFRKSILEVIAVFLQQGVSVGSRKIAVRIVFGVLLLGGVVLENAYSGQLICNLTYPKLVGRINNIHDFVNTNYLWGAPHIAYAYGVELSKVRDSMLMHQRFQILSNEQLKNLSFSGKFGLGVERLQSGRITLTEYITLEALDHLTILKDDLFYDYTFARSIKGWPFMEKFNKITLETLQHGLFVHWETELCDRYFDLAIDKRLSDLVAGYEEPNVPKILEIAHISGLLVILLVGEIFAFIIFIGEHLWLHYANRTQSVK